MAGARSNSESPSPNPGSKSNIYKRTASNELKKNSLASRSNSRSGPNLTKKKEISRSGSKDKTKTSGSMNKQTEGKQQSTIQQAVPANLTSIHDFDTVINSLLNQYSPTSISRTFHLLWTERNKCRLAIKLDSLFTIHAAVSLQSSQRAAEAIVRTAEVFKLFSLLWASSRSWMLLKLKEASNWRLLMKGLPNLKRCTRSYRS